MEEPKFQTTAAVRQPISTTHTTTQVKTIRGDLNSASFLYIPYLSNFVIFLSIILVHVNQA